jgi:hypothetical protein
MQNRKPARTESTGRLALKPKPSLEAKKIDRRKAQEYGDESFAIMKQSKMERQAYRCPVGVKDRGLKIVGPLNNEGMAGKTRHMAEVVMSMVIKRLSEEQIRG